MKMLFTPLVVLSLMMNVAYGEDVKREITKVTGDVYRFQNKFHVNVFVITGGRCCRYGPDQRRCRCLVVC